MVLNIVTKPADKPNWSSTTAGSIIAPDLAKRIAGWGVEKPPFQNFNWFWNLTSKWIDFVDLFHVQQDLSISDVDTEEDYDAVIAMLNFIKVNNATVVIAGSYAGSSSKTLRLNSIKGKGTIAIVMPNLEVGIAALDDIECSITFNWGLRVTQSTISKAFTITNCKSVVAPYTVSLAYGKDMAAPSSATSYLLKVQNSKVEISTLSLNEDYGTGVPTNHLIKLYNSELITTAINVTNSGAPSEYGRAIVYADKYSTLTYSTTTFDYTCYPTMLETTHYPKGTVQITASSGNESCVESILNNIQEVSGTLLCSLIYRSTETILLSGVHGSGTLTINTVASATKLLFIENCSLRIGISGLTINYTEAAATHVVRIHNSPNTQITALNILRTHEQAYYALYIQNCRVYISNFTVDSSSTITAIDRYIKFAVNTEAVVAIADAEDLAENLVPFNVNASNLRVIAAAFAAGKTVGVKLENGAQLICRNPGPAYVVFYDDSTGTPIAVI